MKYLFSEMQTILPLSYKPILFFLAAVLGLSACQTLQPGRTVSVPTETGLRDKVVAVAMQYEGSPYRYGGSSRTGFDCSGLMHVSFGEIGIQLPRTSSDQYRIGSPKAISQVQKGDLLFYSHSGKINHVALVTRVTRNAIWVIHSTTSRGVLHEDVLASSYWPRRFKGARDVISR